MTRVGIDKRTLVRLLAAETNLPQTKARDVLTTLVSIVTDAVANGDRVKVTGLGTFDSRFRPARTGRVPGSETLIPIPATIVPTFNASDKFKAVVAEANAPSRDQRA